MGFPAFFAQAPRIQVRDDLADLLGAADGGLIEYSYADAVRLAGHSCPTVAGAWLMLRAALRALYPDGPAERGAITVTMSEAEAEGTTGVMAQVFTLVTGAAAANGFHGIGGRYKRRGLLHYASNERGAIASLRRNDSGETVNVAMDLSSVPPAPEMRMLMGQALSPAASDADRAALGAVWQERVRRLLLEHADDPRVIIVHRHS